MEKNRKNNHEMKQWKKSDLQKNYYTYDICNCKMQTQFDLELKLREWVQFLVELFWTRQFHHKTNTTLNFNLTTLILTVSSHQSQSHSSKFTQKVFNYWSDCLMRSTNSTRIQQKSCVTLNKFPLIWWKCCGFVECSIKLPKNKLQCLEKCMNFSLIKCVEREKKI